MTFKCNDGASMQSGLCGASEYSFDFDNEYKKSQQKHLKANAKEDPSSLTSPVKETPSKDESANRQGNESGENECPAEETFMVVVNEDEFRSDVNELNVDTDEKVNEEPFNYKDMELGSIFCWCAPTGLSSYHDGVLRTLHWFQLNKDELMAGIAVAIGQVPQATSYALLAGVSPSMAIQTTWMMNIITSIFGGRPGMISGTTALSAIALIDLIQNEGESYIFYAVMLAGILQMVFGFFRLGRVLRFVPHSAMVGYVNAMGIIISLAQIKYFKIPGEGINVESGDGRLYQYHFNFIKVLYEGTPWVDLSTIIVMIIEATLAFFVCIAFPRISKMIPSPVLAFLLVTALEWSVARYIGFPSTLIGDYTSTLSTPLLPIPIVFDSRFSLPPMNYDTWKKVWPSGLSVFVTTLADSLLTYRVTIEKVKSRGSSSRMAFWARIGAVYLFFLIFYAMTLAGILQMVFGFF